MIKKLYQICIRILIVFVAILFISAVWIGVFEKSSDKANSEADKQSAEALKKENHDYLKFQETRSEEIEKRLATEEKTKGHKPKQEEDLSKAFDIKVDNFDKEMRDIAKKLTLDDFSISKADCKIKEIKICNYKVYNQFDLIANGYEKSPLTSSITLTSDKGDKGISSFLGSIGVLLSIIDPSLTDDEIEEIFFNTILGISLKKDDARSYMYNNIIYIVSMDKKSGIITFSFVNSNDTNKAEKEDLIKTFDIKVDNFDKEMQRVAEKLTLEAFSIKLKECGSQAMKACQYYISGEIGLVATGDKRSHLTSNVILFFGKGSDVVSFMSTVGLLIATIDPSLTKNERGKIFNNTVSKISPEKGEDNDYEFIYNGFKYNLSTDEISGIWFSIEKE